MIPPIVEMPVSNGSCYSVMDAGFQHDIIEPKALLRNKSTIRACFGA
jgi:hypothetical protein